jgi:hypothetical protein
MYVSAASTWEIAIKAALGKLRADSARSLRRPVRRDSRGSQYRSPMHSGSRVSRDIEGLFGILLGIIVLTWV